MREARRHKKKRKKAGWGFLIPVMLLAGAVFAVLKVFTVEKVVVKGNHHYSDEVIQEWLLDDEYSWNSLYVYFKYNLAEPKEIPFVDSIEVLLKSPRILEVDVNEKALLGRVYIASLGQNAYFDKDGFVVEMSSDVMKGVPKINGLDVDKIELYKKLPIKGKSVLKNLLALTQMLKKYDLVPDSIRYGGEGSYTLKYGKISVLLGPAQNFNQKVVRLSYIMPELKGQKGTLHLECWTDDTTDVTFEKSG